VSGATTQNCMLVFEIGDFIFVAVIVVAIELVVVVEVVV